MVVVMLVERVMQHAGAEQPLRVGERYDLPDGIAAAFIATGVARVPEKKSDRPPEGRPAASPEKPKTPAEDKNLGGAPENGASKPGGRKGAGA